MTPTEYAIIVAGGKGTRMKTDRPKQFLELNGKPIILHTLEAFIRYSEKINIILVLSQDEFQTWHDLSKKYQFKKSISLQAGGESRFQSVKKGLEKIQHEGLVAIHDGVRPLVKKNTISESFRLAAIHQSAVAAIPLRESIRIVDQGGTRAADRSDFRIIQTPQTFQVGLIKKAYDIKESPDLTDDATVAERSGHRIFLFEGSYDNIKITTAEDIVLAEALLRSRSEM